MLSSQISWEKLIILLKNGENKSMNKSYNLVHHAPKLLHEITLYEKSQLSDIFWGISDEENMVYKEILTTALTAFIAKNSSYFKSQEEAVYMWEKFSDPNMYRKSGCRKVIVICRCKDAETPFHSLEKGQELEENKLYLYHCGAPNTGGGGEFSTAFFNLDYSYAGKYSLSRFDFLNEVDREDYPEEIKRLIEKERA